MNIDGFVGKMTINNKYIYWGFSWEEAFKYSNVKWNLESVSQFLDILDNHNNDFSKNESFSKYCWSGLSNNLNDKDTIVKYKNKLNYYNLSENDIIWDEDLLGILIEQMFKNEFEEMDGYYGYRVRGLPYILENIFITEKAILAHREFWFKKYYYGRYHRNSDGSEKVLTEYQFIKNLKLNKNVNIPQQIQTTGNTC